MSVTGSLSIDRTGLSLSALVFTGADGDTRGLVELGEPARLGRVTYAAPSPWLHGSQSIAGVWEHTNLNAMVRLEAASAAALQTLKDELVAAVGQFSYTVTTTVNGVVKAWAADMGSVSLAGDSLSYENLRRNVEVYRVTIPVYPIAS
jgi:hypothetical protein